MSEKFGENGKIFGSHDLVRRMDRQGEVLIGLQENARETRDQTMGPKFIRRQSFLLKWKKTGGLKGEKRRLLGRSAEDC